MRATRARLLALPLVVAAWGAGAAGAAAASCQSETTEDGRLRCFWTGEPPDVLPPAEGCTLDHVVAMGCEVVDHLIDRTASNPLAHGGVFDLTTLAEVEGYINVVSHTLIARLLFPSLVSVGSAATFRHLDNLLELSVGTPGATLVVGIHFEISLNRNMGTGKVKSRLTTGRGVYISGNDGAAEIGFEDLAAVNGDSKIDANTDVDLIFIYGNPQMHHPLVVQDNERVELMEFRIEYVFAPFFGFLGNTDITLIKCTLDSPEVTPRTTSFLFRGNTRIGDVQIYDARNPGTGDEAASVGSRTDDPYQPGCPQTGDLNGDGFVTVVDVVVLQQHLTGAVDPPPSWDEDECGPWGDVNEDGEVDVSDTVYLIALLNDGGGSDCSVQCPHNPIVQDIFLEDSTFTDLVYIAAECIRGNLGVTDSTLGDGGLHLTTQWIEGYMSLERNSNVGVLNFDVLTGVLGVRIVSNEGVDTPLMWFGARCIGSEGFLINHNPGFLISDLPILEAVEGSFLCDNPTTCCCPIDVCPSPPDTNRTCGEEPLPPEVVSDPHFVGFDGTRYDHTGTIGKVYSIVTDRGLAVNARFGRAWTTGASVDGSAMHSRGTWMEALGVASGGQTLTLEITPEGSCSAALDGGEPAACEAAEAAVGDAASLSMRVRAAAGGGVVTVSVDTPELSFEADLVLPPAEWGVKPAEAGSYSHWNIRVTRAALSAAADGLLGATWHGHGGALVTEEYRVASLRHAGVARASVSR